MAADGVDPSRRRPWWKLGSPTPELTLWQWWWLPFAWVLLGALFSLQPLLWGGLPWVNTVRFEALRWWPWLLLAPLVVWLSLRLPLAGSRWQLALGVHVLACLAVSIGIGWLTQPLRPRAPWEHHPEPSWHGDWHEGTIPAGHPPPLHESSAQVGFAGSEGPPPAGWFSPPPFAIWWFRLRLTLPLYWSLVGLAHLLLFQVRTRRASRLEVQLAEARLATLQMQLQPHFLFNSLNAISSLVRQQPEAADEMICMLATLLRAALENQGRKEISLQEELRLARQYLQIQRVRFGAALQVVEEIDDHTSDIAVPPLLLQPLLENAVTHGLGNQAGTITLRAGLQAGQLCLTITDRSAQPGSARAELKPGSGIGLSNTRARLAALYGEWAIVTLRDDLDSRSTEVRLPCSRVSA